MYYYCITMVPKCEMTGLQSNSQLKDKRTRVVLTELGYLSCNWRAAQHKHGSASTQTCQIMKYSTFIILGIRMRIFALCQCADCACASYVGTGEAPWHVLCLL